MEGAKGWVINSRPNDLPGTEDMSGAARSHQARHNNPLNILLPKAVEGSQGPGPKHCATKPSAASFEPGVEQDTMTNFFTARSGWPREERAETGAQSATES